MGTTIIMVTHNKELVNSMHKRVVSIEEGHIISDVKKEVMISMFSSLRYFGVKLSSRCFAINSWRLPLYLP